MAMLVKAFSMYKSQCSATIHLYLEVQNVTLTKLSTAPRWLLNSDHVFLKHQQHWVTRSVPIHGNSITIKEMEVTSFLITALDLVLLLLFGTWQPEFLSMLCEQLNCVLLRKKLIWQLVYICFNLKTKAVFSIFRGSTITAQQGTDGLDFLCRKQERRLPS